MDMLKRTLISLSAMILSLKIVFAANDFFLFKPIVTVFSPIHTLLKNDSVVIGIMYVAYIIGFYNIMRVALKPVFGDHYKERNTISVMISFIGVTGMFYIFKDTPAQMITLFGGSIGFVFLSLIGLSIVSLVKSINTDEYEGLSRKGLGWVLISLGFVSWILTIYIQRAIEEFSGNSGFLLRTESFFIQITYVSLIIGVILLIMTFSLLGHAASEVRSGNSDNMFFRWWGNRRKNKRERKEIESDEEVKNIRRTTNNVHANLENINESMKRIKKVINS